MEKDVTEIPEVCQFAALNLKDDKRVRDERPDWISKEKIPIWSRQLQNNCVGYPRDMASNKKGNYNIEIPSRLWSLWGNILDITSIANQFAEYFHYESVCCVLALCSALKYNLDDWSADLLNSIYTQGFKFYQDMLTKLNLSNLNFQKKDLCTSYQFQRTLFKVALESVATGYVYIPYGFNEYNIARALTYFFNNYQFGLICCNSKTLAIGYCVDIDDGYFMFDCQSKGDPLFRQNDTTPYILRCNHLQILLYCIVVTLNVSKLNTHFIIYNVDINIDDSVNLSPRVKPWKKLTTNLTFKKDPKKTQTPQLPKFKRETIQKIKKNIAFGLSGPTNVKVSTKFQDKEKDKENVKEKMISKFANKVEKQKEKVGKIEVKQSFQEKNNTENPIKSNLLLKKANQNTTGTKKLAKASSFHAMPTNNNRNATRLSEGNRKVYLVENKSKPQIKTVNTKIIVVSQLSELMNK